MPLRAESPIYVSSYYICVLLLYMCPVTILCVHSLLSHSSRNQHLTKQKYLAVTFLAQPAPKLSHISNQHLFHPFYHLTSRAAPLGTIPLPHSI